MARKKSRVSARRVKDKWKAKEWYTILAPEMFDRIRIGDTPTDDPKKLMGRIAEVTVQDLTGDLSKMHIKLQFRINDIQGSNAHTQFIGQNLTSDYIRRMTRRKRTKIDGTYDVYTKDKYFLRIKPMAIPEKRVQASQQTAIRAVMRKIIEETAKQKTIGEFVKMIISGEIVRNISIACKTIYPVKRIEIRRSEVLRMGILPEEKKVKVEEKEKEVKSEEKKVKAEEKEVKAEEKAKEAKVEEKDIKEKEKKVKQKKRIAVKKEKEKKKSTRTKKSVKSAAKKKEEK